MNDKIKISAKENKFYDKYFDESIKMSKNADFGVSALQLPKYMHLEKYYPNTLSTKYLKEEKKFWKRYKKEFKQLFPRKSDMDYYAQVFNYELTNAIKGFKFPFELLPFEQLNNPIAFYVEQASGAPSGLYQFKTKKDYMDFMHLTKDFAEWCKQAIKNMKRGVKKGVVQPKVIMKKFVESLKQILENKDYVNPNVPKELKKEWNKVIRKYLVSSIKKVLKYTEKEYLPKCRDTIGYYALPNGKEWYEYIVDSNTTLDITIEQIHKIGLGEVKRIRGEMEKVKKEVKFKGTMKQFAAHLKTNSELLYLKNKKNPTNVDKEAAAEELFEDYRNMQKFINETVIPKYFDIKLSHDYEIRKVPSFMESAAPAAYYMSGDLKGTRKGTFYLNLRDLETMSKMDVESLSLHEGNPGHHYQLTVVNDDPDIPLFVKMANYVAYGEGWGLYSENFGEYSNPYSYMGKLNMEMLRAVRLVVDTGIHYYKWSYAKTKKYFEDNTLLPPRDIIAEIDRYIADPGQALGYKLGELFLLELKDKFVKKYKKTHKKNNKDTVDTEALKKFHRIILKIGHGPLIVIKKWFKKSKLI